MIDPRYDVMSVMTSDTPDELNMFTMYDPLTIDWSTFKFNGKEAEYYLSSKDIERPDLLSYKFYGTVIYQDILFILNNIGDILNTPEKTLLRIPKEEDIKEFILKNRKNK
jgi:hypothetical protein